VHTSYELQNTQYQITAAAAADQRTRTSASQHRASSRGFRRSRSPLPLPLALASRPCPPAPAPAPAPAPPLPPVSCAVAFSFQRGLGFELNLLPSRGLHAPRSTSTTKDGSYTKAHVTRSTWRLAASRACPPCRENLRDQGLAEDANEIQIHNPLPRHSREGAVTRHSRAESQMRPHRSTGSPPPPAFVRSLASGSAYQGTKPRLQQLCVTFAGAPGAGGTSTPRAPRHGRVGTGTGAPPPPNHRKKQIYYRRGISACTPC
jgi:hypothetical protein